MSDFLSAAFYMIAGTLPYRVLSYYPVRDRLRVPVWVVGLLIGVSELLEAVLFGVYVASGGTGRTADFIFAPVCLLIYVSCVRADVFRLLFLYTFITDYLLICRGLSLFLEARLFFAPDMTFFTFRSGSIQLLTFAVTVPFMYLFFRRTKERVFRTDAPRLWKTIWLIPALNTFVTLAFTSDLHPEFVASPRFLLARVAALACILPVYSVLLQSLDTIRAQAASEEKSRLQEQTIALQRSQFTQLRRHMEETRAARHDLRQHLKLIQAYLDGGDRTALQAYISAYGKSLPRDTENTYCKNYAVDVVARYYAQEARTCGADFLFQANLPETLPIDEPEFCALLGNLLENAVDALRELPEGSAGFLRLNIHLDDGFLTLTADNSCAKEPETKDGELLSSKHEGFGIGTRSVRTIAEKYQGSAEFGYVDGEFRASVFWWCKVCHILNKFLY